MPASPGPHRIALVGAGLLGLSTVSFLQEHGAAVTALERATMALGELARQAGLRTRVQSGRGCRPIGTWATSATPASRVVRSA
jgi:glycine/D-amino acid oxidase-like deaminating enzyme